MSDSTGAAIRAFEHYERIRHRLPLATFGTYSQAVSGLLDLADDHDVFVLDGFGVLNVGNTPIPGVPQVVAKLQELGKQVFILTNAAGYPKLFLMKRYASLGYAFAPEAVTSSREVMLSHASGAAQAPVGVMANEQFGRDELPTDSLFLTGNPDAYERAETFYLLGSSTWTEARQQLLLRSLQERPRPVFVGNPDLVAPTEVGLSKEPGSYAHALADETAAMPIFHGKPFPAVFEAISSKLAGDVKPDRIVMVGDTLHTDILGGRTVGWKTALVIGFGVYVDWDFREAIGRSGICPDYIMVKP
ncbi:MAG: HAD hydrolase-like protein [Pseudomonadota bacterium]